MTKHHSFSKPLFTKNEKVEINAYNSTLSDIYRISIGEKLKRKNNNPRIYT